MATSLETMAVKFDGPVFDSTSPFNDCSGEPKFRFRFLTVVDGKSEHGPRVSG
jgi:hypothetical protein